MNRVFFRIISADRTITSRWQTAFQKEGWQVSFCPSPAEAAEFCNGLSEISLIEVATHQYKTAAALKEFLLNSRAVSTLAFGDQERVTNAQIAAFLEAGADDFICKNLDERVLVAKLKAHVRRIMPIIEKAGARLMSQGGDIQLDKDRRAVKLGMRSGKCEELDNLTQKEFSILSLMVNNEGHVMSREEMLEKLWGEDAGEVYSECIDKHVESLRRKLGAYGNRIKTVYGSGYMFLEAGATGNRRER